MKKRHTLFIAQTAVFLALLITFQALSAPLGQYLTGSLVNLVLVMSLLVGGIYCAITLSVLSPCLAFLLGIGPAFPQLLPIIALGNVSIVLVWFFTKRIPLPQTARLVISTIAGALTKFCVLFFGVVKIALPLLSLAPKQVEMLSLAFSYPQLVTALIGGTLAIFVSKGTRLLWEKRKPKQQDSNQQVDPQPEQANQDVAQN